MIKHNSLIVFLILFLKVIVSNQQIESDVYYWLNKVRSDPKCIIPHIQHQLDKFKGNNIALAPHFNYRTQEGPSAWIQAIQFLKRQRPMQMLQKHFGLDKAAKDHVLDLASRNMISHTGSDGSTLMSRIKRYCSYRSGQLGQNVAQQFIFQGRNVGMQTIVSLIIDDGVLNRGHRQSIFNIRFNYVGIGSSKSNRNMFTVIDLSSQNLLTKQDSFLNVQPIYKLEKFNKNKKYEQNSSTSRFQTPEISFSVNKTPKQFFKDFKKPFKLSSQSSFSHPQKYSVSFTKNDNLYQNNKPKGSQSSSLTWRYK